MLHVFNVQFTIAVMERVNDGGMHWWDIVTCTRTYHKAMIHWRHHISYIFLMRYRTRASKASMQSSGKWRQARVPNKGTGYTIGICKLVMTCYYLRQLLKCLCRFITNNYQLIWIMHPQLLKINLKSAFTWSKELEILHTSTTT